MTKTTKTPVVADQTNPGSDDKQSAFVSCDMTLFIRLLEVAREELKTDEALHQLVERCSQQYVAKGKPLTMDDYSKLVPSESNTDVMACVLARLTLTQDLKPTGKD